MALDTKIRRITREQLAKALGNDHRTIKAFEDLIDDLIANVIPAVDGNTVVVEATQDLSETAAAAVAMIEGVALAAFAIATGLESAPPQMPAIPPEQEDQTSAISALREAIAALESRIAQLEVTPP